MQRSTRGRRPPKHPAAGSTRKSRRIVQYLVTHARAARLIATADDWSKLMDKCNGTPAGQANLSIVHALAALVRLLTTWDTPEGEALTNAAFDLGEVPQRFANPPSPPAPAELPPSAPTVAPSSPVAPPPRLSIASSIAERLESLLTDIAGHVTTIEGAIGEARAEIEAAAPPASRVTTIAAAELLCDLERTAPGYPAGSTLRPLSAAEIADLRAQVDDIASAGLDAVDAPSRRRLGRRTARVTMIAAYRKARAIFALAESASPGGAA